MPRKTEPSALPDQALELIAAAALNGGGCTVPLVIPATPSLNGLVVRSQALLLPGATIVGVEATNAVALTLGP